MAATTAGEPDAAAHAARRGDGASRAVCRRIRCVWGDAAALPRRGVRLELVAKRLQVEQQVLNGLIPLLSDPSAASSLGCAAVPPGRPARSARRVRARGQGSRRARRCRSARQNGLRPATIS